jgi:hypothetical protein
MITLEKLIFTKELIISVSIEKSIVLEERYRFYPEYTKKFLGFIKCRQKNYMRDMIYSQESRKYENIEPGQSIRLPNSVFYCGVKDGIIGEDMYSDGSYKVYRLPYIIIYYKIDMYGNNIRRKEYTFKTEKELNEFLNLLYEKGLLTDKDLFYDRTSNKLIKNVKL